jgi:hypothetical protein
MMINDRNFLVVNGSVGNTVLYVKNILATITIKRYKVLLIDADHQRPVTRCNFQIVILNYSKSDNC